MAYTQWTAGTRILASKLAAISPKFTSWTPAWTTAAGTPPDYGNAVLNCRYAQTADLVVAYFDVTFGTTTVFGSGGNNWRFSLPVESGMTGQPILGWFETNHGSTNTRTACKARQSLTTTIALEVVTARADGTAATSTGELDNATPETWASTHTLKGTLMYEAA